jgi:hypothetical protein
MLPCVGDAVINLGLSSIPGVGILISVFQSLGLKVELAQGLADLWSGKGGKIASVDPSLTGGLSGGGDVAEKLVRSKFNELGGQSQLERLEDLTTRKNFTKNVSTKKQTNWLDQLAKLRRFKKFTAFLGPLGHALNAIDFSIEVWGCHTKCKRHLD